MTAGFEAPFGGKKHFFRLPLEGLQELQAACNAGPATILARLMSAQPQAANIKRPNVDDYQLGAEDPDFLADWNTYSLVRGIGGDWRVEDVRETIRLGLIGAGMTPTDAFIAVSRYVDQTEKYPLIDNVGIAAGILHHALTAPAGENPGKAKAEETTIATE
ncbi:gene transfer agent family protein [Agrobacterium genomosp. 3 str. CIP 111-78]|uniref:Gene transfer agent family protein n=1 Tax=Agrobacterium tumefaciens TaxID=358 RepID=A0AAE6BP46_AGRTU|nr:MULTISPECIES: gene transfer agent family protein [Agrobacterium tumefaciens complex]MCA2372202.1 gene transfer agent family protein [Agrobacterium tomkonis CIP 111-78]QCM02049.1 gene transfer agent family protein [Agrobacterium tumefaciens]